ncbi:MAG: hypothetical protein WB502_09285 [Thermoactinomyces sp.]
MKDLGRAHDLSVMLHFKFWSCHILKNGMGIWHEDEYSFLK